MPVSINTFIGRDVPCVAVVDVYYPGRPGRYFGPPEDCYEDEEDEIEWHLETAKNRVQSHRLLMLMSQDDSDRITDELMTEIRKNG